MTRPPLYGLPKETLQNIYRFVDPTDLKAISLCSRYLHDCQYHIEGLYKALLFEQIDSPPRNIYGIKYGPWDIQPGAIDNAKWDGAVLNGKKEHSKDWEQEFLHLLRFIKILESDGVDGKKRQNFEFIVQNAVRYLRTASTVYSTTVPRLIRLFDNESNRDTFMCQSRVFERVRGISRQEMSLKDPQVLNNERNLSAQLHCLYGVPIDTLGRTRSRRTYPFACAKVYDIRNYTEQTRWGPFLPDGSGRVDWEMMEAIMLVIGHNVRRFGHVRNNEFCKRLWSKPWVDAVPYSYIPKMMDHDGGVQFTEEQNELIARDPYGVTGTWMRVVCFLDYTEFFAYNFANPVPAGAPRQPVETEEATRYIIMELTITKIEPPSDEGDFPGQGDGPMPVVHFRGTSRSMHQSWDENANANLKGTVRLTPEGEIRWTTSSVYFGEERWRSESIQVGGIQSARGALGNWFDKDFDPHGPVGPTAFWKVSDKILESREEIEAMARAGPDMPAWAADDDEHDHNHHHDHEDAEDAEDGEYDEEDADEEEEVGDDENGHVHFASHFVFFAHANVDDDEDPPAESSPIEPNPES